MPSLHSPQAKIGLLTGALIVALLLVAFAPSARGATTRTLTIWNGTTDPTIPYKTFDSNPAKLFDIDGDGEVEIIANNDNNWVYVFDSSDGSLLFEGTTRFPTGWGARTFNGPEVSPYTQGGVTRLIVANSAAYITSFRFDFAASIGGKMVFIKEWERRANDCYSGAGMDAKPVLADLDKDGHMEILAMTEEFGIIALRDDGSLYWKNCLGGGNGDPTVADLNLDGWPDVVAVSDGGVVAALNGRTGGWMWGYNVKAHYDLRSGSISVGAGIGQLDGVGGPDIIVAARDSHDTTNFENDHVLLLALSSSGQELWHFQDLVHGNPLNYCHPVIVDADGNGVNEVYWGDWNTIGHKGGIDPKFSWKTTGPANFYRLTNNGNVVWHQMLNTYWSNKDLALADVDGDGVQEVLANGPGTGGDGIWYLDSRTGVKERFVVTSHWKVARGPLVADLWNTGTMQWVVEAGAADTTVQGGGILVFDTHVPYSSVYPHLPYPSFGSGGPPPTWSNTPPTTSPPDTSPPTTSPPPGGTFKEAEEFATKTTGARGTSASASGGAYWNLWSNGHIQDTMTGDGTTALTVVARGTPLGGTWPTMVVSVDGSPTATFTVEASSWATFTAPPLPLGSHTVRVAFTNDALSSTEDRNLHVDVVRLPGPSPSPSPTSTETLPLPTDITSTETTPTETTPTETSPTETSPTETTPTETSPTETTPTETTPTETTPTSTTPPPPGVTSREAETFATRTTGGLGSSDSASGGQYWNLWSNGHIQDSMTGDGVTNLVVFARGSPLGGVWPTMVVSVDGTVTGTFTVSATSWTAYSAPPLPLGSHTVKVAFTNDALSGTEDRNLHLDVVHS